MKAKERVKAEEGRNVEGKVVVLFSAVLRSQTVMPRTGRLVVFFKSLKALTSAQFSID